MPCQQKIATTICGRSLVAAHKPQGALILSAGWLATSDPPILFSRQPQWNSSPFPAGVCGLATQPTHLLASIASQRGGTVFYKFIQMMPLRHHHFGQILFVRVTTNLAHIQREGITQGCDFQEPSEKPARYPQFSEEECREIK